MVLNNSENLKHQKKRFFFCKTKLFKEDNKYFNQSSNPYIKYTGNIHHKIKSNVDRNVLNLYFNRNRSIFSVTLRNSII